MAKRVATLAGVAVAVLCGVLVRGEVPRDEPTPAAVAALIEIELLPEVVDPEAIPSELTEPRISDPEDQEFERALRKRCRFRVKNAPLTDILRVFEDKIGLPLRIDEQQLADEGLAISKLPRISCSSSGLTARSALRRVVGRLRLDLVLEDGELVVVTPVRAAGRIVLRQYPVGDLVSVRLWNGIAIEQGELRDLLHTTVQPDTWDEVGGPGSVRYEATTMSLLIRQSQFVHEEIETMLRMLRDERRRLPRLLQAAGGPGLDEIQKAEASDQQARIELKEIEDAILKAEGGVAEKGGGMMGGMGGGFFDVAEGGGEPPAGGEMAPFVCGLALMPGNAGPWRGSAEDARKLAFRAMRLALRLEGAIPDDAAGEAADEAP